MFENLWFISLWWLPVADAFNIDIPTKQSVFLNLCAKFKHITLLVLFLWKIDLCFLKLWIDPCRYHPLFVCIIEIHCCFPWWSEPLENKRRHITIMIFLYNYHTEHKKNDLPLINLTELEAQILWVSFSASSRDPALKCAEKDMTKKRGLYFFNEKLPMKSFLKTFWLKKKKSLVNLRPTSIIKPIFFLYPSNHIKPKSVEKLKNIMA